MHGTDPLRLLVRLAGPSALCAMLLLAPAPRASAGAVGDAAADAGLGLAAGTLTVAYVPLKVLIASSGFLVGGAAWAVTGGDPEPAHSILRTTAGGDWLVTQDHLRGRREFSMLGRSSRQVAARGPAPSARRPAPHERH